MKINPLLKEIQLDRMAKEMYSKKNNYLENQQTVQCDNMYDWPNRYNIQQQEMMGGQQQPQMGQSQQIQGSAIPQTFLPSQYIQPSPPQHYDQNFPFNPYASPHYSPGCPIPGLPDSYPQFPQYFYNMSQPQSACYQQDYNMAGGPMQQPQQQPTNNYQGGSRGPPMGRNAGVCGAMR